MDVPTSYKSQGFVSSNHIGPTSGVANIDGTLSQVTGAFLWGKMGEGGIVEWDISQDSGQLLAHTWSSPLLCSKAFFLV